jgi:hypothetical protein
VEAAVSQCACQQASIGARATGGVGRRSAPSVLSGFRSRQSALLRRLQGASWSGPRRDYERPGAKRPTIGRAGTCIAIVCAGRKYVRMPPCIDVYVLSECRDRTTLSSFLSTYSGWDDSDLEGL